MVGSGSVAVAVALSKVLDGTLGSVGRDKGCALRDGRASRDLDLVLVGDLFDNLCDLATVGEDGDNPLLVHDGFTDLLGLRHCCSCWLMGDGGRVLLLLGNEKDGETVLYLNGWLMSEGGERGGVVDREVGKRGKEKEKERKKKEKVEKRRGKKKRRKGLSGKRRTSFLSFFLFYSLPYTSPYATAYDHCQVLAALARYCLKSE
jgi:hypothetical protein